MKPGDMIMIDGILPAVVRAIRTPAEIVASLPRFAGEFLAGVSEDEVTRIALVAWATHTGGIGTATLIETPAGWETVDGNVVAITILESQPCN